MSDDNGANNKPVFDIFSVHERKDGKSHFHKLGTTFPHKDGEGHTLAPYSEAIDKNAKIVIRTTRERLEAKKHGNEAKTHSHDSREH
ncbi:MAG: hypothetical protein COC24_002070 [Alphaproteobacteria bacterium]|nr:hypothetical protein [Alphaproteobacteria bacterium]